MDQTRAGAPLESVSLCTRFPGFSTISSFSFNRLSWKLVGMFFGIVSMFVARDFVRNCFRSNASSRRYAPKCACAPEFAHICARKRRRAKSLATKIGTIPKNMSTNFQRKRLTLNLDIVEQPENRVHKLTDSNVSPRAARVFSVVTLFDALKWAYNPNHSPNLDASPNH